jgi:hypothetical protein
LCPLGPGARFEGKFGAFDDGPVVGVEAPRGCEAGHFAIADFNEAPVKLCVGVPAEDKELTGWSVLKDQLVLIGRYAVPDWSDVQEQQPRPDSKDSVAELGGQPGEKEPQADQEDRERLAHPGEDGTVSAIAVGLPVPSARMTAP